mmetsp:Transcript_15866/g.26551  ORF Transcript_15866/g.26551 Transcript_15866/m.26551 type:complete len:302 (+) Transcript_15866:179-1084(+)
MNSLELVALEPYVNGELRPHTAGIIRDIEEKNEQFEEEDKFERVEIRRGLEIRLVKKFDKPKINPRRECWYLMDCRWLTAWADYVENKEGAEKPGPLSTKDMRDENGFVLPGLIAKQDYRGVPSTVYWIFYELYGSDGTEPFCRYVVNMYQLPVTETDMIRFQKGPKTKARILVNKIRSKYVVWTLEDSDDEEDDNWCCCGCTKDHVESILFWVFTCCQRGRSGRAGISYRAYKPLKRTVGDGDGMSDWSERSDSTLASIETDRDYGEDDDDLGSNCGYADRNFGRDQIFRNWASGMLGYK